MIFMSSVSSTEFDKTKKRPISVEIIQNHTKPQIVAGTQRNSREVNEFVMTFTNIRMIYG